MRDEEFVWEKGGVSNGEGESIKGRSGECGREMRSLCEGEGVSVEERGREYGRGRKSENGGRGMRVWGKG